MSDSFLKLEGRRVLITGASGVIGTAVAKVLSSLGTICALQGRNLERLEATRNSLEGKFHQVLQTGFESGLEVDKSIDCLVDELGGVDSVVHCIGQHSLAPLRAVRDSEIDDILSVNVKSAILVARSFRRKSVPKIRPSIVFLGSVAGLVGESATSIYGSSKGAIMALTKSLSIELVRDGIRVNSIVAGALEVGMLQNTTDSLGNIINLNQGARYPLGLGEPEDIANCAAFLVSDKAKWITGTNLVVDGGFTAR